MTQIVFQDQDAHNSDWRVWVQMLHLVLDLLTLIVTKIFTELFIWPMFQIKEETQSLSPAVSRGFPDVPPGFAPEL